MNKTLDAWLITYSFIIRWFIIQAVDWQMALQLVAAFPGSQVPGFDPDITTRSHQLFNQNSFTSSNFDLQIHNGMSLTVHLICSVCQMSFLRYAGESK